MSVEADAKPDVIKAAYRKLALKLHPDVSDAADATEQFAGLSNAYGKHKLEWRSDVPIGLLPLYLTLC